METLTVIAKATHHGILAQKKSTNYGSPHSKIDVGSVPTDSTQK